MAKTRDQSILSCHASPAMPHHSACVRYCVLTNAVCYGDTCSGSMCSKNGGGGGYRVLQQSRGDKLQCSPESLEPIKNTIGVVFRSMHPPQAVLEPCQVTLALIPGSTLRKKSLQDLRLRFWSATFLWRTPVLIYCKTDKVQNA